jgi:hypothetical protein
MTPVILAHGALGLFDEVVFIAVAVTFVAMMGIAWWRSRGAVIEADEDAGDAAALPQEPTSPVADRADRYRLE